MDVVDHVLSKRPASITAFGRTPIHIGLIFIALVFSIIFPLSVSMLYSITVPVIIFLDFLVVVAQDVIFPRDVIIPAIRIRDKKYFFIKVFRMYISI